MYDLPEWLAAVQPLSDEALGVPAPSLSGPGAGEGGDDLLTLLSGITPAAAAEEGQPPVEIEQGELPPWLQSLRPEEERAQGPAAPAEALFRHFGITPEAVAAAVRKRLN